LLLQSGRTRTNKCQARAICFDMSPGLHRFDTYPRTFPPGFLEGASYRPKPLAGSL